jgi:hypothetical protein
VRNLVIEGRMGMCILKKLGQQVTVQCGWSINIGKKAVDSGKINKHPVSPVINFLFHANPPVIMNSS